MTRKLRALQLVDNVDYTKTNCYQHQLHQTLSDVADVKLVTLDEIANSSLPDGYDRIVCTLRQRTIAASRSKLERFLKGAPFVLYEQDPWEAYKSSTQPGLYEWLAQNTNLKMIAVTTAWWADYIATKGLPSKFVRMWVLPEYCDKSVRYFDRRTDMGFIGTVHPWRKRLFDDMYKTGMHVNIFQGNGKGYVDYLKALRDIRIFIRSENNPIKLLDGTETNVGHGIWIRDIEVASQGCWSLREKFSDKDMQLYANDIPTIKTFSSCEELLSIVCDIYKMEPDERDMMINTAVDNIKNTSAWRETAKTLLEIT